MYELFYTSLPRGLVPGTSGYTTVGHTSEMSRTLIEQAEKLSSYSFLSGDPTAYAREPVSWAHLRVGSGGQAAHVVSRIAACVPDYTGRSNYLAHHAFLTSQEAGACKAGPAALAATPGFLETQWQGEARFLPVRGAPAVMDRGATTAAIESAGIDPGWAGALADRLRDRNIRQTFLVYSPGTNIIGIVGDVLSDLSPEERWQATFATHATKTFPGLGVECRLQCVVAGTPYAQDVLKRFPSDAFDLANLPSPPARAQRPRAAVTSTGPRPTPATKPLMAPPASTVRSARTETYATEAEQTFDLNSFQMPTIAQPPIETGSHGGFGSLLFLVPTVISALMTIGCALLGYQWIQKGQQLADLSRRYNSLESKHDDLKQQLDDEKKTLTSVRKELQSQKDQVVVQNPSKTEVARQQPETIKPPVQNTAAATPVTLPAMAKDGEVAKTNPEVTPDGAAPARASTDVGSSDGEKGRGEVKNKTPPRVPENVQSTLGLAISPTKPKSKKVEIPLVQDLDAPPSNISLDDEKLCNALGAEIVPSSNIKWTVRVRGKDIAFIKYELAKKTLVLDLAVSPFGYLARFLTLRLDVAGGQKIPPIPLGSPLNLELQVAEAENGSKPGKGPRFCTLFRDEEVNALLDKMLEEFKDAKPYESIEFHPDAGIESFSRDSENLPPSMKKPLMPENSFVLSQRGASPRVGVVLMRKPKEPGVYAFHSYVVDPLQYGKLGKDNALKGPWNFRKEGSDLWYFSLENSLQIMRLLQEDLDHSKDPKVKEANPQAEAKLNAAKDADSAAFTQAQKFVEETLLKKSHPVRFELKVPGSDVGFVLVDSRSTPGGGK